MAKQEDQHIDTGISQHTELHGGAPQAALRDQIIPIINELLSNYGFRIVANNDFVLKNLSSNPSNGVTGQLAVVGGKLKIYDGSAWTTVGTQT